jgi:dTDP-4-dehydrorhamnose 3,5-epimerase
MSIDDAEDALSFPSPKSRLFRKPSRHAFVEIDFIPSMIFQEAELKGVFIIDPEREEDERGFFARTWCQEEFKSHGLNPVWVQDNLSFNKKKGTLRGLHYQTEPHGEIKLVRCTMGSIYDAVVDLRRNSPSFRQWLAIELSAENRKMLYIPKGFAHGYQTLTDHTEVFYQMSESYHPESARGVKWNDPAFGIHWPKGERILSDQDRGFQNFRL